MTSTPFLDRVPLRDALFLGFCAGAIIVCKILFRWHLGISGHSMFFTLIGLMVARSCVSFRWGATLTGVLAGLMAMTLGLGKGGPLILTKFVVPALVIDGALLLFPMALWSVATCVVVALLAGSTKFFLSWTQGTLLGMDRDGSCAASRHRWCRQSDLFLFGRAVCAAVIAATQGTWRDPRFNTIMGTLMKILVSIDDTDNLESCGTGELATQISQTIEEQGWGTLQLHHSPSVIGSPRSAVHFA